MKLSEHFDLEEFTHSQQGDRWGIDNSAPQSVMVALAITANGMENVRRLLGNKPISISSGYRCPTLNMRLGSSNGTGGRPPSQHLTGEACDFICPAFGNPESIVRTLMGSDLDFDQMIMEFASEGGGWVHISFSSSHRNRRSVLAIDRNGARPFP